MFRDISRMLAEAVKNKTLTCRLKHRNGKMDQALGKLTWWVDTSAVGIKSRKYTLESHLVFLKGCSKFLP